MMGKELETVDYLIIGGGIIGLTVARALLLQGCKKVVILEKEKQIGLHASGRNSGVVHAGIYYGEDSFKAKFCHRGMGRMIEYASERGIKFIENGKIIVASNEKELEQIFRLYELAKKNGAIVSIIDENQVKEIEPYAKTCQKAIYSPKTSVIDSKGVLESLKKELAEFGSEIYYSEYPIHIDDDEKKLKTNNRCFEYNHLINCAGAYADKVAHSVGVGKRFKLLPFKGMYFKLASSANHLCRGSIYPVPDPAMPFLGVHFTKNVNGEIYVGPTAMPAFGRENYHGMKGVRGEDFFNIFFNLSKMMLLNKENIRKFTVQEMKKYSKKSFLKDLQKLVPTIKYDDLDESKKVGIRAQLIDLESLKFVMDFVIEKGENSTHVLNAVSPAFTSSLEFADHLVSNFILS